MGTILALLITAVAASAQTNGWPEGSRLAAARLTERYGAPDQTAADRLRWLHRGPFNEIVVYRDEDFTRRSGVVEQSVSFDTPVGRWRDLTALGAGVVYDPVGRMLVASAESVEVNILGLNVAVDVIRGRRGVEDAKSFYRKTLELSASGKSSRYLRRLLFTPTHEERRRRPAWLQPLMP